MGHRRERTLSAQRIPADFPGQMSPLLGEISGFTQLESILTFHVLEKWYGFCSSHVQMRELENKEGWALKNWCFWAVVLEKTLESPLDCREIKPGNPKRYQSWIFIGRTDTEVPILWPPDAKNWIIWKDPDAGKDWRQEEKGMTEDEMVGWHH